MWAFEQAPWTWSSEWLEAVTISWLPYIQERFQHIVIDESFWWKAKRFFEKNFPSGFYWNDYKEEFLEERYNYKDFLATNNKDYIWAYWDNGELLGVLEYSSFVQWDYQVFRIDWIIADLSLQGKGVASNLHRAFEKKVEKYSWKLNITQALQVIKITRQETYISTGDI